MSSGLSIGLSGIIAARKGLDIVGQNIANATTAGYARREVSLSASSNNLSTSGSGGGVTVDAVLRIKDMFLEGRVQSYTSSLSRADIQTRYFTEIEGLIQEPSEEGIGAMLETFYNQWQAVALRPEDMTSRNMLLLTAANLADRISTLRSELVSVRNAVLLETRDSVDQVNALTEQLAHNNQLTEQFAGDANRPLSLEDERDSLMKKLAELIGASNTSPFSSKAQVLVGSMLLVSGSGYTPLSAPVDYDGSVTMHSGQSQMTLEGAGGKIGGLLDLNQKILPEYIGKLDELAVSLMRMVNGLHAEGIPSTGSFDRLMAQYAVKDVDGDGDPSNTLLAAGGLPFTPSAGMLMVNVVNEATGEVTAHNLAINPSHQTLADLIGAFNGIENLSAGHVGGRLQITAASGFRFDFAARQGTDILAALGINAFFDGTNGADIKVSDRLAGHPELVAAGQTALSGDGSNAAAISELRYGGRGESIGEMWQGIVTEIGLSSAASARSVQALDSMVRLLGEQEQSISGVSLDEEAAKIMQFQQMYTASARYMAAVSKLMDELLNYL